MKKKDLDLMLDKFAELHVDLLKEVKRLEGSFETSPLLECTELLGLYPKVTNGITRYEIATIKGLYEKLKEIDQALVHYIETVDNLLNE